MSKWMITVLFLIGSAILTHWLPFSSFFRNVDTMIHEFGHAAVTLLLSGKVLYIYLYEDHSGVTLSAVQQGWRSLPVALAGYSTASLFARWLFALYRQGRQRFGLWLITFIAAASLLFFVRNGFGVLWLIGFIALSIAAGTILGQTLRNIYYLFIAFLTLEESVFGPISLLIISVMTPNQAGDATGLAHATGIPAVGWALGFTIFSLYCARGAILDFLGKKKSGRSRKAAVQEWQ